MYRKESTPPKESLDHSKESGIEKKIPERNEAFQYTFEPNKLENDDSAYEYHSKERKMNFDDPYSNIATQSKLDEEEKSKNIFEELENLLKKHKQSYSAKYLPNSASQPNIENPKIDYTHNH